MGLKILIAALVFATSVIAADRVTIGLTEAPKVVRLNSKVTVAFESCGSDIEGNMSCRTEYWDKYVTRAEITISAAALEGVATVGEVVTVHLSGETISLRTNREAPTYFTYTNDQSARGSRGFGGAIDITSTLSLTPHAVVEGLERHAVRNLRVQNGLVTFETSAKAPDQQTRLGVYRSGLFGWDQLKVFTLGEDVAEQVEPYAGGLLHTVAVRDLRQRLRGRTKFSVTRASAPMATLNVTGNAQVVVRY
jgi:hypothetical protein